MKQNRKVEICGMYEGTRIRVTSVVKEDLRRKARVAMMDANTAALASMYTVDDNLITVFYFESSTAVIYSFVAESKVITLFL